MVAMSGRRPIGAVDRLWLDMDVQNNLMVIDSIMWFDAAVDWSRLTEVIRRRLLTRYPVFSQRPVAARYPFGTPHWEDDPDFRLRRHLRRTTLRRPGGDGELQKYVQAQLHRPLDRRHPLWEMHFIDGYRGGSAVLTRFHHALADGIALAALLLSLTDTTPTGDLEPPAEPPQELVAGRGGLLVGAARSAAVATSAIRGAVDVLSDLPRQAGPRRLLDAVSLLLQTGHIADKLLLGSDPATSLAGTPGGAKLVAWSGPRSLPEVKRVGRLAGATVNDVVVSAVSAAISDYLLDHGCAAIDLTTMVPVNVRPPDRPLTRELGNCFALVLLPLATGRWAPLQRLSETKIRMDAIKDSPEALLTFGLISAIGRTGPRLERLIVDFFSAKAFGVTTNVAGPATERFVAGSPIAGLLGWVPGTGRQGVGVSIFTYNQAVRVGFKVDAAIVPDPDKLVHAYEAAIDERCGWSRPTDRSGRCRDVPPRIAAVAMLERESPLRAVAGHFAEAAAGHGRVVFIAGEAGVGKTTFINGVLRGVEGRARVALGSCDGSSTPAPLGPLAEMLPALPEGVWPAGAARHDIFARLSAGLREVVEPHLLVFEDVHWADEATLDLIRHLARRVHRVRALVLVTYRAEEAVAEHPLRILLGDVATAAGVRRVELSALTVAGVRRLVAAARGEGGPDAEELHRATGGNPFFVTEVLASGGAAVPASVRDAVLSRAARLSAPARRILDLVALAGPRAEIALLEALAPDGADGVDEALDRGMLQAGQGVLVFRHELVRLAIADEVPALRRIAEHRRILAALEAAARADPARLAHHAEAAALPQAVLRHAPQAAGQASALGAHREAAEQYRRALRHADGEPDERRAGLLAQLSFECFLTGRIDEALTAQTQALDIWERLGATERIGDSNRWLSRLNWFAGRNAPAERHGVRAVEVLSETGGIPLAMAYSNLAALRMIVGDLDGSRRWAGQALAHLDTMPPSAESVEVRVHALNSLGSAELSGGGPRGRGQGSRGARPRSGRRALGPAPFGRRCGWRRRSSRAPAGSSGWGGALISAGVPGGRQAGVGCRSSLRPHHVVGMMGCAVLRSAGSIKWARPRRASARAGWGS